MMLSRVNESQIFFCIYSFARGDAMTQFDRVKKAEMETFSHFKVKNIHWSTLFEPTRSTTEYM